MIKTATVFLTAFLVTAGNAFTGSAWTYAAGAACRGDESSGISTEYDLLYVPTSHEVVAEMLKVAAVGKDDVVYDLGCGDGRIVIECARRGARSTGVDLNPERIRESNENAARAGLTGKVQFLQQDIFQTDFSDATVLMLYLLPEVMSRLRTKILAELRPGTRIVSHDFMMDDWEPDKVIQADGRDTVYYWVVPVNASGTWRWTLSRGTQQRRYVLQLDQTFQKAGGALTADGARMPLRNVRLSGDRLRFSTVETRNGKPVDVTFTGRVRGHRIEGILEAPDENKEGALRWEAHRDPSTRKKLESTTAAATAE